MSTAMAAKENWYFLSAVGPTLPKPPKGVDSSLAEPCILIQSGSAHEPRWKLRYVPRQINVLTPQGKKPMPR